MKKTIARLIASIMLALDAGLLIYSANHPKFTFPWNEETTNVILGIYTIIMFLLFVAPFKSKEENKEEL